MNRNINEDVAGYKNEFWKGLTFRECFFGSGCNRDRLRHHFNFNIKI